MCRGRPEDPVSPGQRIARSRSTTARFSRTWHLAVGVEFSFSKATTPSGTFEPVRRQSAIPTLQGEVRQLVGIRLDLSEPGKTGRVGSKTAETGSAGVVIAQTP